MNDEIPFNPSGLDAYIRDGARKNSALLSKMEKQTPPPVGCECAASMAVIKVMVENALENIRHVLTYLHSKNIVAPDLRHDVNQLKSLLEEATPPAAKKLLQLLQNGEDVRLAALRSVADAIAGLQENESLFRAHRILANNNVEGISPLPPENLSTPTIARAA